MENATRAHCQTPFRESSDPARRSYPRFALLRRSLPHHSPSRPLAISRLRAADRGQLLLQPGVEPFTVTNRQREGPVVGSEIEYVSRAVQNRRAYLAVLQMALD